MLLEELKDKKNKLETTINIFICEAVNDFIAETGSDIDRISITLNNVRQLGSKNTVFVLVSTEIKLDI